MASYNEAARRLAHFGVARLLGDRCVPNIKSGGASNENQIEWFLFVALVAAALVTSSAQAVVYLVDRTFSDGFGTATLTGTVTVPLGNYVIQNMAPNPFTNVNLTLTVNAVPFPLSNALTAIITGTGQFTIDATTTELIFSASGDGGNSADLVFSDNFNPFSPNRYVIGSDGTPSFQIASTTAGFVSVQPVPFPNVFGIVVPEPASALMLIVGILATSNLLRTRAFRAANR